jgi:4-hydroxy-3-methylbut-2-en-1-yl diphosphate synthase IspG/GcpE
MEKFAIINSGQTLSDVIDLRQYFLGSIMVPAITSGDLLIRGGVNSGSLSRMLETRGQGSGDTRFATGAGDRAVTIPSQLSTLPYAQLETSVAQADVRTFALVCIRR